MLSNRHGNIIESKRQAQFYLKRKVENSFSCAQTNAGLAVLIRVNKEGKFAHLKDSTLNLLGLSRGAIHCSEENKLYVSSKLEFVGTF